MLGKRIDNKIGQTHGIIRGENGKQYFFHKNFLSEGEKMPDCKIQVQFDVRIDPKKNRPEAFNIKAIKPLITSFPYTFIKRPGQGRADLKKNPTHLHDRLNDNCLDLAFEVEWTALTPIAANPCSDLSNGSTCPANNDKHYQGYDKRWLMIDQRLALSPFTVKSAVANGFAAIMGSCYRVSAKEERSEKRDSFFHTDTVPNGQDACNDLHLLCPRCSLFGMTNKNETQDRKAIGFKGRFKAAALINDKFLKEQHYNYTIPNESGKSVNEKLRQWLETDDIIAQQLLLPILAEPKPQKRDNDDGYYHNKKLKGAKVYFHGHHTLHSFIDFITKKVDLSPDKKLRHTLRNYSQLCRENLKFTGTLGVENCTPEEAAALFMVLDHRTAQHGFKIGMGKALGLGSMKSCILKIWLRDQAEYRWRQFSLPSNSILDLSMIHELSEVKNELDILKMTQGVLARINRVPTKKLLKLEYPAMGKNYWPNANKTRYRP